MLNRKLYPEQAFQPDETILDRNGNVTVNEISLKTELYPEPAFFNGSGNLNGYRNLTVSRN